MSDDLKYYVESFLVSSLNENLNKFASDDLISSTAGRVKDYVDQHINPDDKVGSFLNLIAPGAIATTLNAVGLGGFGTLIGLSLRVFHVNVWDILKDLYNKFRILLSHQQSITPQLVDNLVVDSMKKSTPQALASNYQLLNEIRQIKLSILNPEFSKFAVKSSQLGMIQSILSWFFKTALAAAGLMVAGDAVNKVLKRPNALEKTLKPTPQYQSRQNIFKINPSYSESARDPNSNWIENIPNNSSSISQLLINFAKEVYNGLDDYESIMKNSPAFQAVKEEIENYNQASHGDPMVFLPKFFRSKKHIVDYFIDDVAQKVSSAGI